MNLIVNVTQGDIERGLPRRVGACPVALAIRRRYPSISDIKVRYTDVDVRRKARPTRRRKALSGNLSSKARNFIYRFDCCKACRARVKPIKFLLQLREGFL
jgi:hypothetical protein